jgi:quercetin dioxygenase-like cupin family protein
MAQGAGVKDKFTFSAGDAAEKVVESPFLRVEVVRLPGGGELPWQRCNVADRVLVVTQGRGSVYRAHGRDEIRDDVAAGDVVYLKRLIWHRVVSAPGEKLVGTLVTTPPLEVELRD